MTKPELRTALKALATRLDLATTYERSALVTLSVAEIDRWRARLLELSEDEVLWT